MKTLLKFGFVGASGGLILLGLTYVLTEFAGLFYLASYSLGFIGSLAWCYYWNTRWTFTGRHKLDQFVVYAFVTSITTLINLAVIYFLTEILQVWYVLSVCVGIGISFTINFVVSRSVIWARSHPMAGLHSR